MSRVCKCGEDRVDNFGKNKSSKDGLTQYCKKCWAEYRAKNKEKLKDYHAVYWQNNKERLYRCNHQWSLANPEKTNKHRKSYRDRNPSKMIAVCRKRQAAKLKRTPIWLSSSHFAQIELFYIAARALSTEVGIDFVVDHVIPLRGKIVSGLHVPWNLQVITKSENNVKGNRVSSI